MKNAPDTANLDELKPSAEFHRMNALAARFHLAVTKCGGYKDAAALTGYGMSTLYNYAKCQPLPGLDVLLKLAAASDSCPHWLILGVGLADKPPVSRRSIELKIDPAGLVEPILQQIRLEIGRACPSPPVTIGNRIKRWLGR